MKRQTMSALSGGPSSTTSGACWPRHWAAVYSEATVKLITAAIREMALDPKVGRAEALRRSMLALNDKGEPQETRPAYWTPFVVVGEGGAVAAVAPQRAVAEPAQSKRAARFGKLTAPCPVAVRLVTALKSRRSAQSLARAYC
jgi:hypothetical protein